MHAPKILLLPLQIMLGELKRNRLAISLANAPDPKHSGHCIRVVVCQNPEWYQVFCSEYTVKRTNKRKRLGKKHHDIKIRRREILEALNRLCSGKGSRSIYCTKLLDIALSIMLGWNNDEEVSQTTSA